jgi:hypothetical protein
MTVELVPPTGNSARFSYDHPIESRPYPNELAPTQFQHTADIKSFRLTPAHYSNESLVRISKIVCQRYGMDFVRLSAIQRKFLTHYRCSQCGLLPLYYVIFRCPKRVRCGKCHQLMSFRRNGKYGKMRKDIVLEMVKTTRNGEKM